MNTDELTEAITEAVTGPVMLEAQRAVTTLLSLIGENPARDGLQMTPLRVVKALQEMTAGYREVPQDILSTSFDQEDDQYPLYNGMVILRDIEFTSLCEHHMLPFVGRAHVAYKPGPDRRIVGLSKLARLVDCFARRLQVQERLTQQVAQAISVHLSAEGSLCVIEASHSCMSMRGCHKKGSTMTTLSKYGTFDDDHHDDLLLALKLMMVGREQ